MSNVVIEKMPHNGNLVKQILFETRVTQSDLARGLQTSPVNITRLMDRNVLKTSHLWDISKVVRVNMFDKLGKIHPVQTPTPNEILLQQRVSDLEKEVAIYKDLLKGR